LKILVVSVLYYIRNMSVHNICRHFTNPYIDGMPDVLVVPDPGPGQIPHIAIQVLDAKPDKKRKKKNTIPKRAHEILSALLPF